MRWGEEWGEVGADNTEKQGHSAFPSPSVQPLGINKGMLCNSYLYSRSLSLSRPPSHFRQHHMQTKWNCSSALLQLLFPPFLKKTASSLVIFTPENVYLQ